MARRPTHSTHTSPSFSFRQASASTITAAVMFSVLITLSNSGIASATSTLLNPGPNMPPSSPDLSSPSLAGFPPPLDSGMPLASPGVAFPDPEYAEPHDIPEKRSTFEDYRRDEHGSRHRHAGLARRLHERTSKERRTRETQPVSRQFRHKTYTLIDSFEGQSFFE